MKIEQEIYIEDISGKHEVLEKRTIVLLQTI